MTDSFAFNANRQTHRGVGIKQWRLVARNLPFATKKEELEEFFGNHGHVLEVVLPKCKDKRFPDSCAGFAFVQYASKGSAENAKKTANFTEFKGRKIAVDYAVDKDTYVTVTHPEKETIEKAERKVFKEEPDAKRKFKPTKANQKTTEKLSSLKLKEELPSDADEEEDEEVRSETKEPPKKKFKDGGKTKKEPKEAVKQEPKEEQEPSKPEKKSDTATAEGRVVFVRNLSFDSTNEMIKDQMSRFGEVSLAIMCKYPSTDQPTGTAFVHFKEKEAADQCLDQLISEEGVLIDGRKVYGYRAVPRDQASAFKEKKKEPKDKRNLYLLRASLIRPGTAQARGMSDDDAEKRARLAEMARTKLKNLHMFVSPNRLAIHNIPFSMSVQELRSACMLATKNVDAQVTECRIMRNKTGEDTHGRPLLGKSKGFGFVAFTEHDDALRCLRNLNNNPETFTNDKRPIVEFSIENLNAIKLQERRKAKSLAGEGGQSEGRQKPKAPPRRTSSAVEETKQEMRSGGQKWMPKKVGVKIRHRDLKKGKKSASGGGSKKGKGRAIGGKKVVAKKTGKKVGGGKRKAKSK